MASVIDFTVFGARPPLGSQEGRESSSTGKYKKNQVLGLNGFQGHFYRQLKRRKGQKLRSNILNHSGLVN